VESGKLPERAEVSVALASCQRWAWDRREQETWIAAEKL